VLGGAVARVPNDATAYAHRDRKIMVNIAALYQQAAEAEQHLPWLRGFVDVMRQGDDAAYVNFLADEGEKRIRGAYPGGTWDRLRRIKATYDPANLFHLNQNIPPAEQGAA